MKNIILIIVLLISVSAVPTKKQGKWIVGAGSQLLISGKTNVNSFTCSILHYNHVDTLGYTVKNKELIFDENLIAIPVHEFDCGNRLITKDLRRTVKADQQPYLYIAFISLNKNLNTNHAIAKMEIRLAGVAKSIDVPLSLDANGELLELSGSQEISFKDFKLVAPRHLLGMVKVQQELNVVFNLVIKPIL